MPAGPRTDDASATRERILKAAAAAFARRGFHGTSTRGIAAAVGIRQPSLFHHFPTKQAILAELLDRDLGPALERIRRIRAGGGRPAARLHAYVEADVAALLGFPYDARGLYDESVLEDPALAPQRAAQREFHAEVRGLVAEGLDAGEFHPADAEFVRQLIHAMTVEVIFQAAGQPRSDLADRPAAIAGFVLRGLLADPGDIDAVRAEAAALKG
ncbi:MAG: TetR/AcrR family transcriptional regulator [Actinobacteria bacterium]|nr:TetR/AcrR family transcriptional regulator [Actinomycetota bacterium]